MHLDNLTILESKVNTLATSAYKLASSYSMSLDSDNRSTFLFSYSNLETRANVKVFKVDSLDNLKNKLNKYLKHRIKIDGIQIPKYMKLEFITNYKKYEYSFFKKLLSKTKRNYFAFGIGFDDQMEDVISKDEINGWCLLYSNKEQSCVLREENFSNYFKKTQKKDKSKEINKLAEIFLFNTVGSYTDDEDSGLLLQANSYNSLREEFIFPNLGLFKKVICKSTDYLASQINSDGKYTYGRWPCFDRKISSYNMLRHFSSTYALVEGWEISGKDAHIRNAVRAINWGVKNGFCSQIVNGEELCFLKEENGELKLGGTAHAIIAISRYTLVSKDSQFLHYLPNLIRGLLFFQRADGKLNHVLDSCTLKLKDEFRTIYYDGEALYALLIAYKVIKNDLYLLKAKEFANSFISSDYHKYHDHWQAYAFRELYILTKEQKYISFLINNIDGYLNFIKQRITTYPTLLELCVASYESFEQSYENGSINKSFNTEAFIGAMIQRAEYLLNGYFTSETAMHFKKPSTIVNSFFIRHHGFRTRIDDNEHYISGLSGFYNLVKKQLVSLDPHFFKTRNFQIDDLRVLKLSMKENSLVAQYRNSLLESGYRPSTNTIIKLTPYKKLPYLMYMHLFTKERSISRAYKFIVPKIKSVERHGRATYIESDWLSSQKSTTLNIHKYSNSSLIVDAMVDFNFYFTSNVEYNHPRESFFEKNLSISQEKLNGLFLSICSAEEIAHYFDMISILFDKLVNLATKNVDNTKACICHNDMTSSNVGVISSLSDKFDNYLAIIDIDNATSGNWGQDLRFLLRENLGHDDLKTNHLSVCNQYVRRLQEKGIRLSVEHVFYSSVFEFAYKSFNIHRQKPQRQKISVLKESIEAIKLLI